MRTTSNASSPGFVVDYNTEERDPGAQIAWDEVPASFVDGDTGKKVIPAGTAMGDAADGNRMVPRSGTSPAKYLLVGTAIEDHRAHAATGYGRFLGGRFYENLLPSFADAAWATIKTELGAAFRFTPYANDAA